MDALLQLISRNPYPCSIAMGIVLFWIGGLNSSTEPSLA